MFVLSQGVKGNPTEKFPPAFWIEPLQRFMRGESCEARVPLPPRCPNTTISPASPGEPVTKAWHQGGYSNDWDCCTSGHARGGGKSCNAVCAKAECAAAGMRWVELNSSVFPYTCCDQHGRG